MTPKTEAGDRYDCWVAVLSIRHRTQGAGGWAIENANIKQLRMTLCGSEVPQDRWRGRTAGSGMWTLTML